MHDCFPSRGAPDQCIAHPRRKIAPHFHTEQVQVSNARFTSVFYPLDYIVVEIAHAILVGLNSCSHVLRDICVRSSPIIRQRRIWV